MMQAIKHPAAPTEGHRAPTEPCIKDNPEPAESQVKSEALKYAAAGIKVFPCKRDKSPLVDHEFKSATTDQAIIESWWSQWPGAAIGTPTGRAAGFFVLDCDIYKEGCPEAFETLKAGRELPKTKTQQTGSGGRQYLFKYPPGREIKSRSGKLGTGLDVKGDGGYTLLPPSENTNGQYIWIDDSPPADAPEWLIDAVSEKPRPTTTSQRTATTGDSTAYGLRALEDEAAKVRRANEGTRNETLNHAAFKLGQLIAGGQLGQGIVEAALIDAAAAAGLSEREARRTTESGLNGGQAEPRQPEPNGRQTTSSTAPDQEPEPPTKTKAWDTARQLLPRTPCPWDVLPPAVAESLQALARSCASTAAPLFGFALAYICAAVGRLVSVSPKAGWYEALIIWCFDIASSGDGKTQKMWMLAGPTKKLQREAHKRAQEAMDEWENSPPKTRGKPPARARGYYCTDLTIEALRPELKGHPTGGLITILSEGSSFIGGQNEFKKKGTDREAYLRLHDGGDIRVLRVGQSSLITKPRVSVIGGIQPQIFRRVFGGDDALYLVDGTVYRGLYTYEPSQHHALTLAGWDPTDRGTWEAIPRRAYNWAALQEGRETTLFLDGDAQNLFVEWRNRLDRKKTTLPPEIRGFLPKTYGHALRLAGAIALIHQFHNGGEPRTILDGEAMQRGITAAMFFLGQAVDAMALILGDELTADPMQTRILEALRDGAELSTTEIYTDVFHRNQKSERIQEALKELMADGLIEATSTQTDGRPKETYKLTTKTSKRSESPQADGDNDLFDLNEPGFTSTTDQGTPLNDVNDVFEPTFTDEVEI